MKMKKKRNRLKVLIRLLMVILFILLLLYYSNKRVMPSVIRISETYGVNQSTSAIDKAVNSVINDMGLSSEDFYLKSEGENGQISALAANTILINQLCANIGETVIKDLENIQDHQIRLPLGLMTGLGLFANSGPEIIQVSVRPKTACTVEYETSFQSAGINQIHFQVWVNATLTVRIVNPLQETEITVSRKIALVNTVISGEVPYGIFSMPYTMPQNINETLPAVEP